MRPATVDEYIRWCKNNWPRSKDGGQGYRYWNRPLNSLPVSTDIYMMVEPFKIPELHGANSFNIIIPKPKWVDASIPQKPNPYMGYRLYPDIGHNVVFAPDRLINGHSVEAYDHPWFHRRYPKTVAQGLAEERANYARFNHDYSEEWD
jgi:hypothetical protein